MTAPSQTDLDDLKRQYAAFDKAVRRDLEFTRDRIGAPGCEIRERATVQLSAWVALSSLITAAEHASKLDARIETWAGYECQKTSGRTCESGYPCASCFCRKLRDDAALADAGSAGR